MKYKEKLRIIPLGGMREVGKNMTVIEYKDEIIVVDCGMTFPEDDMPGIDIVIPDIQYLIKNKQKIKGIVITHGHEDHIGAVPYVLKQINVPVYGTKLTLALLENKLKEHRLLRSTKMVNVSYKQPVKIGKFFEVEWVQVNHSIPDAAALAITTPLGVLVHSGDFKVDFTPISGDPIDLNRLAEIGNRGVLALFSESTNVLREGFSMSERKVGATFDRLFALMRNNRIIIATFASNVYRIQQIITAAERYNRKVVLSGRSMLNVMGIAENLGYLKVKPNTIVDIKDMNKYNPRQLVLITTGSQGEPMSAMTRISTGEHKRIQLTKDDVIILSAHPIPGNESAVNTVINRLLDKGVRVIYESLSEIHVSGHAYQEEHKLLLNLLKPKFFIPIHGEVKHLLKHAEVAQKMGVPKNNIFMMDNGNCLEMTKTEARRVKDVEAGQVLIDGLGIGDVGNIVLRDRKHLAEDGLIIAIIAMNKKTGQMVSGPDIISRGFVYVRESTDLMNEVRDMVTKSVENCKRQNIKDWSSIKSQIRDDLRNFIFKKTRRNPMILPIIMDV
ncbi:ribonuclease J [Aedoeadaptatus acetigenes]|uniref:Ribonuclease J n=1 Tax=Aedoeadaptatus acetigenes TaxID=2981723 RepID=A0ABV1J6B4_9FIRM|nr:ribonuclease J [Aedoeadaptatus acetigenes]MBS6524441.1 ribonuclease J [Peptoniphilaceae bacterium]MCU6785699.1 ribonuclease J [Aedoeadaptatus acetigenes]